MADLPQIWARTDIPEVALPRTNPNAYGYTAFGQLADLANAMAEKQKPIDVAKQTSDYEIAVEDLKNEVQSDPDPNNWRPSFMTKEATLRQGMLDKIQDRGVKEAFQLHVERNLGRHVIDLTGQSIKASHAKQLGDIETVSNAMAQQAANTDDPALRDSYINTVRSMIYTAATPTTIGGRPVPGALTPKQAEQAFNSFNVKVRTNQADGQRRANPEKFIADATAGKYNDLDLETRLKITESARQDIARQETASDRATKQISDRIEREAAAQANYGALNQQWLSNALSGNDPYITPDKARQLKNINDNPPTGDSALPIRAIMQRYHSAPSTFGQIKRAWGDLNALARQQQNPNPLLDKALNEIQTDWRTMTGIDATRINRDISAAKEEYEANNPKPPFRIPGMDAKREQDKAKIGAAIRKGQDPKAIIDKGKNETKARIDAVPQSNKNVIDLLR